MKSVTQHPENNTLLLAKLSRPRLFDAAPRERLFQLLDDAWQRTALWISSPAGAGKTTLVASYIEARKQPHLWYQLDAGDSDVATFFLHLSGAVSQISRRKTRPLPLFTLEYQQNIAGFSRRFFRELCSQLSARTIVALDNYHEVDQDSAFHEAIFEALREVPRHVLIIIISREGPPKQFSRYRANQSLGVLGWDEIRLTEAEAGSIAKIKGYDEQALQYDLYRLCGGWTAGLILLMERSMHGGDLLVSAEGISREAVFDYFAGEILDRSSPTTQQFLIGSSRNRVGKLGGVNRAFPE